MSVIKQIQENPNYINRHILTYDEINFGTHKNSPPPEVNELFWIRTECKSLYGDSTGNRTRVAGMRTRCPNR